MRIYNKDSDQSLNTATIYLSISQAKELMDALETLITHSFNSHIHVSSEDYQKEVTVCIYNTDNLGNFNARSKKLILENK